MTEKPPLFFDPATPTLLPVPGAAGGSYRLNPEHIAVAGRRNDAREHAGYIQAAQAAGVKAHYDYEACALCRDYAALNPAQPS